jgi:hypothetical protein
VKLYWRFKKPDGKWSYMPVDLTKYVDRIRIRDIMAGEEEEE